MGVALSLLWLTLCDRHPGARGQRPHQQTQPVAVATASSAQRRAAIRSPPASAACALMGRRCAANPGTNTPVLPGRRGRVQRRHNIAGGQGRDSQREVTNARDEPAELGRGLEARVGRGAGRDRLTLPRQRGALVREAIRLKDPIVGGLGLGGHRAELCDGSGQIALA